MSQSHGDSLPMPQRVPSGIDGLDTILRGGLFEAGIYIVAGRPGAGKTIFGNQIAYHHVKNGGRAVYVTLLAETHGRMLTLLQTMSFFDATQVGRNITYVNGFTTIESGGLEGLLQLLRGVVREQRANLLVLDGVVTASVMAKSTVDYKKFIHELQTWVGIIGCTVIFLTSASADSVEPEHTMVDGIFELSTQRAGLRGTRVISVTKFRGSAVAEGGHVYAISSDGWRIFPRLETHPLVERLIEADRERVSTGVAGLDMLMDGGVARNSNTLLLGSAGSGKTLIGLQFLLAGAERGERGLYFGFYENPPTLFAKAARLELPVKELAERGLIQVEWRPVAEAMVDQLANDVLTNVKQKSIRRVFVDGLIGFRENIPNERMIGFFSSFSEQLTCQGVTSFMSDETRELYVRTIEAPTSGVSTMFHNIVFVRQAEMGAKLKRMVSIMKTRDSAHSERICELEIRPGGVKVGVPISANDERSTGLLTAEVTDQRAKNRPRKRRRTSRT